MCDVSYVQPHDDADVRRADAMTVSPAAEAPHGGTIPMTRQGGSTAMAKVDYADARKPSELSGVGSHKASSGFDVVEGSDGRRAMLERIVGELAAAGLLRWGDAP